MERVAKFEKVSLERFIEDYLDCFPETSEADAHVAYDSIKLPQRATTGSAGYDFCSTMEFTLAPNESIKIPTGIRAKIREDYVLMLYPRSGLGFKFRLQLNNTVGVVDSDYYNSANEGHIFIKVTNDSKENKTVSVPFGGAFAQGVFMSYGITEDDKADGIRNGGFGSTNK